MKIYFTACLCNWPKSLSWCAIVDWQLPLIYPLSKPNHLRHSVVFPVGYVCHGLIFILETSISTPGLQNGLLLSLPTLCQKTWGKRYTLKEHKQAFQSSPSFTCWWQMLCLYATWCLLCSFVWVYQGSCFWFNYVLFLSQRWWWWWWVGAGWGILRAYCSISKFLGLGREGVMCGFAFTCYLQKWLYCFVLLCRKSVMYAYFLIKHSGFWKKMAHESLMGQEIMKPPSQPPPPPQYQFRTTIWYPEYPFLPSILKGCRSQLPLNPCFWQSMCQGGFPVENTGLNLCLNSTLYSVIYF